MLISLPNFGHWYPRLRTLFGIFDYDQRGFWTRPTRFFTRRSLLRMLRKNGLEVVTMRVTGLPIDVVGSRRPGLLRRLVTTIDGLLVRLRPTLFGYQFVLEVRPPAPRTSVTYRRGADSSGTTRMHHPTPEF